MRAWQHLFALTTPRGVQALAAVLIDVANTAVKPTITQDGHAVLKYETLSRTEMGGLTKVGRCHLKAAYKE